MGGRNVDLRHGWLQRADLSNAVAAAPTAVKACVHRPIHVLHYSYIHTQEGSRNCRVVSWEYLVWIGGEVDLVVDGTRKKRDPSRYQAWATMAGVSGDDAISRKSYMRYLSYIH